MREKRKKNTKPNEVQLLFPPTTTVRSIPKPAQDSQVLLACTAPVYSASLSGAPYGKHATLCGEMIRQNRLHACPILEMGAQARAVRDAYAG